MGVERNPLVGFEARDVLAVYSATSTAAGGLYPASNLGFLPVNLVWRSASYTLGNIVDQVISWTYTGNVETASRLFAIVRPDLTIEESQFRLELFSDTAMTTKVFDSATADLIGGADIFPVVYTDEELEWEDDNYWTAKYTAAQIAGRTFTRVIDIGVLTLHKAGKLTLTDPNNPNLYLQFGFFGNARGHQFTRGIALGTNRGGQSNEVSSEAAGGVVYVSDGVYKRVFRGNFQFLQRSEAENVIGEMKARNTKKTPFIWHPFPADPKTWLRYSGLYHFSDLDLGQFAQPLHDTEPVSLIEA